MQTTLWTLLLIAFACLATAGEPKFTGKDSPLRTLPSMDQRMKWCAEPKLATERLERYEAFWEIYHPKDGEGDDDVAGRAERICAYRLATLYLETGNKAKCRWFLKWLEEHDSGFLR